MFKLFRGSRNPQEGIFNTRAVEVFLISLSSYPDFNFLARFLQKLAYLNMSMISRGGRRSNMSFVLDMICRAKQANMLKYASFVANDARKLGSFDGTLYHILNTLIPLLWQYLGYSWHDIIFFIHPFKL